jgi:outer membrane protein TolC
VPDNFKLHPLVQKVLADRAAMGRGEINVDWGMGEHLAFASLVASGYAVRLSGEDCGRGTFTHRHAVIHDQNRENWDVGVNMEWSMWQWGSTYYAHDKSVETVKQIRADLDKTRLNAGFEVKNGLLNMQTAADRIGVARKSVEASRESYRMALARYQAQVGTNTDLLTAQSDVTKSEAELNGALADYAKALSSLYVSMGQKNLGLTAQ